MIAAHPDGRVDLMLAEQPYLRRAALALTRHDADADDLVQETFFRAYRAHRRLRPGSRMRAWLMTILRRTQITAVRQRRRRHDKTWKYARMTLRPEGPVVQDAACPDGTQLVAVAEGLDERLLHAVARVPALYRVPLCRFALEGMTYGEIADQLGIPRGTVMSRIFRARMRVRRALAEAQAGAARGAR